MLRPSAEEEQGSVIHPGPDRTRTFCSGPDPARTRKKKVGPGPDPTGKLFVTFGAFFTIFWVQTQSRTRTGPEKETGGPGPDPTGPETKPLDPARTLPENFFSGSQTPDGQLHIGGWVENVTNG